MQEAVHQLCFVGEADAKSSDAYYTYLEDFGYTLNCPEMSKCTLVGQCALLNRGVWAVFVTLKQAAFTDFVGEREVFVSLLTRLVYHLKFVESHHGWLGFNSGETRVPAKLWAPPLTPPREIETIPWTKTTALQTYGVLENILFTIRCMSGETCFSMWNNQSRLYFALESIIYLFF